jgi:hypothetical protein
VADTALSGQVTLVTNPALLGELARVLAYPRPTAIFDDPAALVAAVAEAADTVDPAKHGARARPADIWAVSTARRHHGHSAGLHSTSLHGLEAAVIFYPNFYPRRQRSGVEIPYVLVTAANWSG